MKHEGRTSFRRTTLALGLLAIAGLAACDVTGTGSFDSAVRVTVRIDEEPAPDVTVVLFAMDGASAIASKTTGSDGVATLEPLTPGSYEVAVVVPDSIPLAGGQPERVPVSVLGGTTVTLLFRLTAESEANIQVVHLTEDNRFDPEEVTISVGTTIRWYNDADATHTITPDGHAQWEATTLTQAGDVFNHTFLTEGVFPYFSEQHVGDGMTGTIIVSPGG